jgi:hypothetical protein
MSGTARTALVITFHNTHDAIMAERLLLDSGIEAQVMPQPPLLGPACGIALRVNAAEMEKIRPLLGAVIAGVYCRSAETEGEFVPWQA